MVATPVNPVKRLTVQVEKDFVNNTTAIRSLDWDRDRFDIEFGLQNGTTYNSYLIRGDKIALVDTSHAKFRQLYIDTLVGLIDPTTIDYLVISHTEPDHSGLVADVLRLAPQAIVVGSKVALNFLDDLVHQPYERQIVKTGEQLDLGQGHVLDFINAPNLHWPDTMFTYDHGSEALYSCDAFGLHYCNENFFDEDLKAIMPDYRFYYDCLMGPNARSVLSAFKKLDQLDVKVSYVANGHGPVLRHHVKDLMGYYRQWSEEQTKADARVAVFYVADYGYSDRLSQAIAKGITKTGVAVEMVDLRSADPQEVHEIVAGSQGIVLSMPPLNPTQSQITASIGTMLAATNNQQVVGLFESYGGNDEPIDSWLVRFEEIGLTPGFNPIRIKDVPSEQNYQQCEEAGTDLGQLLTQKDRIKARKAINRDLDRALGRISAGLYIITARKGDLSSAMLASWVSQASFAPPGFTIAVAKDRAIESLMKVGDTFVLNVLEEGKYKPLMNHFLKRFAPGSDRFAGIDTQTANNGSPILTDALAYLECEVVSRMECPDHWIVYSKVSNGRVANPEGLTAVHHRKVGNYY
ncbi:MAG: MBL fold metallo-hydrolase [Synechococcaceae cyanobacterium RL_1_2]|nr:MBL fold metallo-hydrolase [Synechococcaceae cyanobacterium RL_1_2]